MDKPFSFFLIVPIGLEVSAAQELNEWCALLSTEYSHGAFLYHCQIVKGGVEFQVGSQSVGYILNFCLKIPSRILQRVHVFKTREWDEVEKELSSVNWSLFFSKGISDWEISASESRMNNEKHIAQFIKNKFENKFYFIKSTGCKAFLRVHDNVFTLSLDTTGEHLHFRGYRTVQGEAPLRENLASFLWSILIKNQSKQEIEKTLIVDPFVGSGTLLNEAIIWNEVLQLRDYASSGRLNKEDQMRINKIKSRLNPWRLNLLGVDSDKAILSKASQNLKTLKSKVHGLDPSQVTFFNWDSTSLDKDKSHQLLSLNKHQSLWLLGNPPYGGKGRIRSNKRWIELWGGALKSYQPNRAVGLGPERDCFKHQKLDSWICKEIYRFSNGGIRVAASLWERFD